MKKPELLSPAGSFEKMQTAFAFGADAVYIGLPDFSLRARINLFTPNKIKKAIQYAHSLNKKIYLTFNIFAHNRHLKKLDKTIDFIKQVKPEAVIISDPGILNILRKKIPNLEIHLSTQANCTNWQAAKFWYDQGIKRIILAREVTLKEITEIHKKVPKLELEYFVHGAMCMSYSGRCILSKWMKNRSANLGDCVQPCRWKYNITEEKRPDQNICVDEDQHGTYIMNSKDLCLIEYLSKLKKAGIACFKIEGRTKSIYYIACITKAYKQAIDKFKPVKQIKKDIDKLINRGYSTGFLFGKNDFEMDFKQTHLEPGWEFVGEIIKYNKKNKTAFIKIHNAVYKNDLLEFITPKGKNFTLRLNNFYNSKNNKLITQAHGGGGGDTIIINTSKDIPIHTVIRRKLK